MFTRAALFLLPLLSWGQAPTQASTPGAPPEVDQALRARVSQYFQYHVDGEFRKAMNLVAEDTQDEYFNSQKLRLKNYEISAITYSDNFQKAQVEATVGMTLSIRSVDQISQVPIVTTWKIEDGKWVWFHQVKTGEIITPMGPSRIDPGVNTARPQGIPEHIDQNAANGAVTGLVNRVSVDKGFVTLSTDEPSSAKVVVHNGNPGFVQLSVAMPEIPGLSVKFDQPQLAKDQDATLLFQYNPTDHEVRPAFEVRIVADPFNQVLPVTVHIGLVANDKAANDK